MDSDAWDKRYIIALGKGILTDLILISLFVMIYVIYNLTVKEIIILPIDILTNQKVLINNFILLLVLVTYFIYKSKQDF